MALGGAHSEDSAPELPLGSGRSGNLWQMADGLIEAFWVESTPYERRLFLDEAAGRSTGVVTFEFNVFDVTLDFDASNVIVTDVLSEGESETGDLVTFLRRAELFADDPEIGDGTHRDAASSATVRSGHGGRGTPT